MGRRYDHVGLAEPLAACWAAIPQQLAQNVGRMLYPPVVSSTTLIDTLVLYVYPQILLKNQINEPSGARVYSQALLS